MPELPEVEIFRRYSARTMLQHRITQVKVRDRKLLTCSPAHLRKKLRGKKFVHASRFGKFLLLSTDDASLVIHFGLTGMVKYRKDTEKELPFTRLRIDFANRRYFDYTDVRKFGEIGLTTSVKSLVEERKLGVDALKVTKKSLQEVILRHQGTTIKSLLMDQHSIAGIGNIYSDEILFQSGIHPLKKVKNLSAKDISTIYRNLSVLRIAIRSRAIPDRMPQKYLIHNRILESPCPRCGRPLKRLKLGIRSSYFCTSCQSG